MLPYSRKKINCPGMILIKISPTAKIIIIIITDLENATDFAFFPTKCR